MTNTDRKRQRLYAEKLAGYWLAELNEAEEFGKTQRRIDECERKAQYWLDRLNQLEGYND